MGYNAQWVERVKAAQAWKELREELKKKNTDWKKVARQDTLIEKPGVKEDYRSASTPSFWR